MFWLFQAVLRLTSMKSARTAIFDGGGVLLLVNVVAMVMMLGWVEGSQSGARPREGLSPRLGRFCVLVEPLNLVMALSATYLFSVFAAATCIKVLLVPA